ncbi:hypothetical protein NLU13_3933 [Sarocladium strictum]|uniref:Uncharacterized protein n=1 Tax=Sarocladium strictum TaxID=5046 RepID=A0AA39GJB3_SARSR|nr:hypothetical protein NLU13_3933 [Sarocladium strictum]
MFSIIQGAGGALERLFEEHQDDYGLFTQRWKENYTINLRSRPITLDSSTADSPTVDAQPIQGVDHVPRPADSTMTTPRVFHCFSSLPTELQYLIWDTAMDRWEPKTYTAYRLPSRVDGFRTYVIMLPPSYRERVKWVRVCRYTNRQFKKTYGDPATTSLQINSRLDTLRICNDEPKIPRSWTGSLSAEVDGARAFFPASSTNTYAVSPFLRGPHIRICRAIRDHRGNASAMYEARLRPAEQEDGPQYVFQHPDGQSGLAPGNPRLLVLGSIPDNVKRIEAQDEKSLRYVIRRANLSAPGKRLGPLLHTGITELRVSFTMFHLPWGLPFEELRDIIARYFRKLMAGGYLETLKTLSVVLTAHDDLTWPENLTLAMMSQWDEWRGIDGVL